MRRRDALRGAVVVGSAWLAGCGGSDEPASPGDDDDPFDATAGELVPPASVFDAVLDLDWEPRDEYESGLTRRAQANAAYDGIDFEERIFLHVEVGAWVLADVEAARTDYDDLPYHDGWGMIDGVVGVESLEAVRNGGREYRTVWRDANAMGGLSFFDPGRGDDEMRGTGRDLAIAMHQSWRD